MQQTYTTGWYRASEGCLINADRSSHLLDGTRRGVIFAHGAGGSALSGIASKLSPLTSSAGYPSLVPDLCASTYAGSNWGNDDSISAMTAALTALGTMGAKTDKVCLFGSSMGAATVMSWARANISKVVAICLTIPVLDVNDIYQNNKGSFRASIGTAYGVTFPTAIPGVATHSANSFVTADLLAIGGIPMRFYCSDDDPIASSTSAATTWAAAVTAAGGTAPTIISMGNQGHAVEANFPDADVVGFFDSCGGRN